MANSGNGVVYIYKGDDTGGAFGRKFTIQVNCGDGVSLAGCTGEFVFAGITKALKNLVNGVPTEVCYSHNETAKMPYGPGLGTFAVYDSAGKRRTFQDSIRVVVTKDLKLSYPGASSVSVDVGAYLTPATADKLGAVKVGDGLSITDGGRLSANVTGASVSGQTLTITKDDGTQVSLTNSDTHLSETDISGMGFTKNSGTVTKVNGVNPESGAVVITGADIAVSGSDAKKINAAIGAKYTKPTGGIPASDIASGVIPAATTISGKTISVGGSSVTVPDVVSPDSSDGISGKAADAQKTKELFAQKVSFAKKLSRTLIYEEAGGYVVDVEVSVHFPRICEGKTICDKISIKYGETEKIVESPEYGGTGFVGYFNGKPFGVDDIYFYLLGSSDKVFFHFDTVNYRGSPDVELLDYSAVKSPGLTTSAITSLFSSDGFKSAAFGTTVTSAANIESGKVATVDGSTGTAESKQTVTVTFKAKETSDTHLRYCELLITGVTADEAVTVSLPAGKYYFADGADKTSAGNNHFVFAECGDGWMVSKSVLTATNLS